MRNIIYCEKDIANVMPDSDAIIFARPIKAKALMKLLKKCKHLKKICASKSCEQRLSSKVKKILSKEGISIHRESHRGRAIEIDMNDMKKIAEMRKDYRPLREIEKILGVPKSTIHYLERHSKKEKIKKGNKIYYLK
ncbi:MAG: hypothetical protein COT15_05265 [Candidatus Diapherotrites archaeon CG08_land_8_20_14_0_20_34_12]|nr:MAG: hypothetical protein COT15_05265 [Candidatus Diapherotrites archaeon CG08_land_8_20_14_0_20_34_12]